MLAPRLSRRTLQPPAPPRKRQQPSPASAADPARGWRRQRRSHQQVQRWQAVVLSRWSHLAARAEGPLVSGADGVKCPRPAAANTVGSSGEGARQVPGLLGVRRAAVRPAQPNTRSTVAVVKGLAVICVVAKLSQAAVALAALRAVGPGVQVGREASPASCTCRRWCSRPCPAPAPWTGTPPSPETCRLVVQPPDRPARGTGAGGHRQEHAGLLHGDSSWHLSRYSWGASQSRSRVPDTQPLAMLQRWASSR